MPEVIPVKTIGPVIQRNYYELSESNPCHNCSAPCCRYMILSYNAPENLMSIDRMIYLLGFQNMDYILYRDGTWKILVESSCVLLEEDTFLCTVHDTPRKPKTCLFFNPYDCWYKRNLHNTDYPVNIIRFDLEGFGKILPHIEFDDAGNITSHPSWIELKSIVEGKPVSDYAFLADKEEKDPEHIGGDPEREDLPLSE
jgi:Fe-S-cluster containining protein